MLALLRRISTLKIRGALVVPDDQVDLVFPRSSDADVAMTIAIMLLHDLRLALLRSSLGGVDANHLEVLLAPLLAPTLAVRADPK